VFCYEVFLQPDYWTCTLATSRSQRTLLYYTIWALNTRHPEGHPAALTYRPLAIIPPRQAADSPEVNSISTQRKSGHRSACQLSPPCL
jgi:hypothetical protein